MSLPPRTHINIVLFSPAQSEVARRGEEVSQGVRDGEPRHVVHSLPLEKGLPEVHRLSKPRHPARQRHQARRCLSPEKGGGASFLHAFVLCSPQKSLLSAKFGGRGEVEGAFTSLSRIPSAASPFPSFPVLGIPSAAKRCLKKEKKRSKSFCHYLLMLGSVLHLSMFCKAVVFR